MCACVFALHVCVFSVKREDVGNEKVKVIDLFMSSICLSPYYAHRPAAVSSSTQTDELTYEDIEAVAKYLKGKTNISPEIGVICGSGLGGLGEDLDKDQSKDVIPYDDIPNFPKTTGKRPRNVTPPVGFSISTRTLQIGYL